MINGFGRGGGFNSRASVKSNADGYYAYVQTSGNGSEKRPSGGGNGGSVTTVALILILAAVAVQSLLKAAVLLGILGLIGLYIRLMQNLQTDAGGNGSEAAGRKNYADSVPKDGYRTAHTKGGRPLSGTDRDTKNEINRA